MKRLIAIQQALKAEKNKTAKVMTKNNGSYTYKYRDAEQILEAVKPYLKEQRCAVVCDARYIELAGILFKQVTAKLVAEDGQVIASASDMVKSPQTADRMTDQQMSGCDTTYCKRYALQNLFAIDNSDDDYDSNNNPRAPQNREYTPTAQAPAPAPAPAAAQKKGMIESAQSAFDCTIIWQKMQETLKEGKMTQEQYTTTFERLKERARELDCEFVGEEGFVSRADLFAGDPDVK
jgi:hypothetical protein